MGSCEVNSLLFSSLSALSGEQVIVLIWNILIGKRLYLISPRRTPDTALIRSALSLRSWGLFLGPLVSSGRISSNTSVKDHSEQYTVNFLGIKFLFKMSHNDALKIRYLLSSCLNPQGRHYSLNSSLVG